MQVGGPVGGAREDVVDSFSGSRANGTGEGRSVADRGGGDIETLRGAAASIMSQNDYGSLLSRIDAIEERMNRVEETQVGIEDTILQLNNSKAAK